MAVDGRRGLSVDLDRRSRLMLARTPSGQTFLEEFWPTDAARRQPFQPEPGCSSPTFRGSFADVLALVAPMTNVAGAWLGATTTCWAFAVTVVVGALMAVVMIALSGKVQHHVRQFVHIAYEIMTVRNPRTLFAIAKDRKPTMYLLPYGIPICIGSIAYFVYAGLI